MNKFKVDKDYTTNKFYVILKGMNDVTVYTQSGFNTFDEAEKLGYAIEVCYSVGYDMGIAEYKERII